MNSVKLAPLLLIFVEVAKQQSFTSAAKKLGLSKSAISQQIKRLEEATEQQLLIRNTRGVALTAIGQRLLERSELLSEQLHLTLTDLNEAKTQPSGRFKVSIPPFFEKNIIIPVIKQLSVEFPNIQPEIVITDEWQDLIEHNLDAAIFGGNIKECDYRALPIGRVSEVFCASPRYLQQYGSINDLDTLLSHRFIATAWQHGELQLFDNKEAHPQLFRIDHYAKVNTLTTATEMVLNDIGISLLPAFIAQPYLLNGKIARILPEISGRAWHFYFLHQYQGEKPIHITRFYQLFHYFFTKAIS